MNLLNLFKRKPRIWKVNDECYIWQEVQVDENEYEAYPAYGVVTKLFKNGKVAVYLFKSRRSVHVAQRELHK